MPPKAKFSKEEIINKAFEIVKTEGPNALTARSLGISLNSSSRPIFTVFKNMDEIYDEVIKKSKEVFDEYIEKGLKEDKAFRGTGIQYITFAIQEPILFHLLFMSGNSKKIEFENILQLYEKNYDNIISAIKNEYGLSSIDADRLYKHLWVYTHGIATLCATKTCTFTETEISDMIKEVCMSLIKEFKGAK